MDRLEKQIGKRVRALRGERTQKDYSEAVGVSQYKLCRVERGTFLPRVSTLISIARESKVSLDWLCTGEDEPFTRLRSPRS
jgi:transcriptional regulator with XRE-family HTH domain